ncbi:hypothetical protein SADO_15044 [Salinisphaera dokdonensis CL-ES53]|uniref:Cardiolipin synthase N-terminal domain-containing protein n=1 Tax=Salinisphaera dokdonensis CL-ES53 TaxID=1304272 RepID=A0ABV2B3V7_9GAMM
MPYVLWTFLSALVLIHVYLQVAVTFLILTDHEAKLRRVSQVAVVWLVPIFGALLLGYFKAEEYNARARRPPLALVPMLWLAGGPKTPSGSNGRYAGTTADAAGGDIAGGD